MVIANGQIAAHCIFPGSDNLIAVAFWQHKFILRGRPNWRKEQTRVGTGRFHRGLQPFGLGSRAQFQWRGQCNGSSAACRQSLEQRAPPNLLNHQTVPLAWALIRVLHELCSLY
jgi:hypothetical protein